MHHFDSNPLKNGTDQELTFDDVTLLVFMGVAGLVLIFVFMLGMLCATHRLEAALVML